VRKLSYKKENLKLARELLAKKNEVAYAEGKVLSEILIGVNEAKERQCPRCRSLNIRWEVIPGNNIARNVNSS